jgi:hypothetical protein
MGVRSSGSSRTGVAPIREEATFYWPDLPNVADGGAFSTQFESNSGVARVGWGAAIGAGTTVMRFNNADTKRMMCGEFINNMRWLLFGPRTKDTDDGLFPGMRVTPFNSVFEWSWMMRSRVALPTFNMGAHILSTSGTTPLENPQVGFPRPGFGFRGDGARFQWEAWGNGVQLEAVPIPASLLAAPTDFAQYSIEIISAAKDRPCTVTARVNNSVLLTRNMDGVKIPRVDQGLAAGAYWLPSFINLTGGGAVLLVGNHMLRYSRYGRDGRDYSV